MRTITNIKDACLAFAEMHAANNILNGGSREGYFVNGCTAFMNPEEKTFFDALKELAGGSLSSPDIAREFSETLENSADTPKETPGIPEENRKTPAAAQDTLPEDTSRDKDKAAEDKPAVPRGGTVVIIHDASPLFGAIQRLRRAGAIGSTRLHLTDSVKGAGDVLMHAVERAVKHAKKDFSDYTRELTEHQREIAEKYARSYVLMSLKGERWEKALKNVANTLVCSIDQSAYENFARGFVNRHAAVGMNKIAKSIIYTECLPYGMQPPPGELEQQNSELSVDRIYGMEIKHQKAVALQMQTMLICRLHPNAAAYAYGETGSILVSRVLSPVMHDKGRRYKLTADEAFDFKRKLVILDEAICRGVAKAIECLKEGPLFNNMYSEDDRAILINEIRNNVENTVRRDMVCLESQDVLKCVDGMLNDMKWNPYCNSPGAIIMRSVRVAMHEEIHRLRRENRLPAALPPWGPDVKSK